MSAEFQAVAQQFVEFYYNTFDNNLAELGGLYRGNSMLTFESTATLGASEIVTKLQNLPFGKIQHRVDTMDAQPANETGGILVMVTGALLLQDEARPMSYVQTFQLQSENGQYFIFNDIFKLVYPAA